MFKTIALDDGGHAVVHTDPAKPRFLEVVAIFYDASRARDYADRQNSQYPEQPMTASVAKRHIQLIEAAEENTTPAPAAHSAKPNGASDELTQRQRTVLAALRTKMNADNLVEAKATALAEAAGIPLGSLHSVLQSLEKKRHILTTRRGSAKTPAVYQVL